MEWWWSHHKEQPCSSPVGTILPFTQRHTWHRDFGALQTLRHDITQKDFRSRSVAPHTAQTGELIHSHTQEFASPRITAFH